MNNIQFQHCHIDTISLNGTKSLAFELINSTLNNCEELDLSDIEKTNIFNCVFIKTNIKQDVYSKLKIEKSLLKDCKILNCQKENIEIIDTDLINVGFENVDYSDFNFVNTKSYQGVVVESNSVEDN